MVNPNERLTVDDALQHPWFDANDSLISAERLVDSIEQLKVFEDSELTSILSL